MTRPLCVLAILSQIIAFTLVGTGCSSGASDQDRLEGSWRSFAVQQGKRKSDPGSKGATGMAVLFSKDKITQREHDHPIFSGTFKLDPTASPRHIDVTIEEGPEFKPGVKLFGIYKFDGESLILCFGEPSEKKGSVRPEGFSLPDTKDITMSFKKEQ